MYLNNKIYFLINIIMIYQYYKLIFNKILIKNYKHKNNKQQKKLKHINKQKMIKYKQIYKIYLIKIKILYNNINL